MAIFSWRTWISQYQKGKTSLDLNKARDNRVLVCSGMASAGPYANLHLTPDRLPHPITSTPHHLIFLQAECSFSCQTNSVKTLKDVRTVREDCQARKLNKEDAMDRCKWRKMIKEAR